MPPTACLINCARGGLIDEPALKAALEAGQLAGAALDVFSQEPPEDFSLIQLPNVVATPHLAASTAEAQEVVAVDVAEQVAAVLRGGLPRWPVNAPTLPQEMAAQIGRYVPVATALGRLQQTLAQGALKRVELRGDNLLPEQLHLLVHHLLAALFQGQTETPVNYINSLALARERGVAVSEGTQGLACAWGERLEAETQDAGGAHLTAAVMRDGDYARLVEVEGFRCDLEMSGRLMLLWNSHPGVPGFIGRLGCVLGDAGVSLQGIQVATGLVNGQGLLLAQLEQEVSAEVCAAVAELDGVARIEWVDFS
jgi:D-3-phosphoglycerate dehydrogenase / 2-oxoglutarate reductase